jgi:hypothetical protein
MIRPLLDLGEPLVKLVQPMPYQVVQQLLDPGNPWGIGDYHKIDHLPELPNRAIDTVIKHAAHVRCGTRSRTPVIPGPRWCARR